MYVCRPLLFHYHGGEARRCGVPGGCRCCRHSITSTCYVRRRKGPGGQRLFRGRFIRQKGEGRRGQILQKEGSRATREVTQGKRKREGQERKVENQKTWMYRSSNGNDSDCVTIRSQL